MHESCVLRFLSVVWCSGGNYLSAENGPEVIDKETQKEAISRNSGQSSDKYLI